MTAPSGVGFGEQSFGDSPFGGGTVSPRDLVLTVAPLRTRTLSATVHARSLLAVLRTRELAATVEGP